MLLLEPEDLLRRTVALTARSLGMGEIWEAGSETMARQMLVAQRFGGAVVALDVSEIKDLQLDLCLIDDLKAANHDMPIAVMLGSCDTPMLDALRQRGVYRVILKPFRARVLLDTFTAFFKLAPHDRCNSITRK